MITIDLNVPLPSLEGISTKRTDNRPQRRRQGPFAQFTPEQTPRDRPDSPIPEPLLRRVEVFLQAALRLTCSTSAATSASASSL